MNTILNCTTVSAQALITTGTAISGSSVVSMTKHCNAVARVHLAKMVDNKGALGVTTISIYETIGTGVTGSIVTACTVTNGLISNSAEVIFETEIKAAQLSDGFKNIYARLTLPTACVASVVIERGRPRYEPQD